MEIDLADLYEIAKEYFDVDNDESFKSAWKRFMYCYEKIRNCPCVTSKDYGSLVECLYLIASDIASDDFFRTTEDRYGNKFYNYQSKHKSLEYICSDALYRIYDDQAIASVSDEYARHKMLILK